MNLYADTLIVVFVKLLILVGFVAAIKYWIKKNSSVFPLVTYWILGLGLVLLMGFTIFQWCFTILPFPEESLLGTENVGPLSAILGVSLYLVIGLKYLKRR